MLASGLGLGGVCWFWASGESHPIVMPWAIPGAEFNVAMDGLSAFFLVPIFLVSLLGNVYGLGYWKQTEHPLNGRQAAAFLRHVDRRHGTARDCTRRHPFSRRLGDHGPVDLLSDHDGGPGNRRSAKPAGSIWLSTHTATLCLFATFALLRAGSGSFLLAPLEQDALTPGMATAIFVLSLVGFGSKAGIMPLHVWLPSAHAIAPSHVSAIMSGVIIKMGIYGLVRVTSLLPAPPLAWGAIVLALGVVSGVLGVALCDRSARSEAAAGLPQHREHRDHRDGAWPGADRPFDRPRRIWVILGLGGSLLHVWNHALFKALLFLSAGSVIHAVHTREIDHLGGLAKPMPLDFPLLPGRGGGDLRLAAAERICQRVSRLPRPVRHARERGRTHLRRPPLPPRHWP